MYDFNFADILIASKRHWKRILLAAIIGSVAIGANTVFLTPRQWSATATIVLGNQTSGGSALGAMLSGIGGSGLPGFGSLSSQGPTTDLYQILLRTWDTRRQVVEACGLQTILKQERKAKAIAALGEITKVDTNPPTSVTISISLPGTPRGLFPPDDSDIKIRQLTVTCINTYTELLKKDLDGLRITSAKSQRVFLEEQVPEARIKFYQAQAALLAWQAREHLSSAPRAAEMLTDELVAVQKSLIEAQIEARSYAQASTRARQLLLAEAEMLPAARMETQNPQIAGLTKALAELEQQLAEQQTFYHKTPEHPDVRRLLIQRDELAAQLNEAYKSAMLPASATTTRNPSHDALSGQLLTAQVQQAASQAKVVGLQGALEQGKRRVEDLSGTSLEYAKLYEAVEMTKAVYEIVTKQYEAARLTEKAEEPIFFVVDPPVVPYKKSYPSTTLSIAVGLLLGLMAGAAWAFYKEWRTRDGATPAG